VHHFSEDVRSLKLPRLDAELFLEMEYLLPPKLVFWYRVFAQPLSVATDDTTSFQPLGMLEAWKLPHFDDCVQVSEPPVKLVFTQSMLST